MSAGPWPSSPWPSSLASSTASATGCFWACSPRTSPGGGSAFGTVQDRLGLARFAHAGIGRQPEGAGKERSLVLSKRRRWLGNTRRLLEPVGTALVMALVPSVTASGARSPGETNHDDRETARPRDREGDGSPKRVHLLPTDGDPHDGTIRSSLCRRCHGIRIFANALHVAQVGTGHIRAIDDADDPALPVAFDHG
jgi:hypothetical protein